MLSDFQVGMLIMCFVFVFVLLLFFFFFALVHNIFAGCNNIERVQHYVFPMAVGRSSCQIGYQLYLLTYLHLMSFSFF